jgi:hypothetical protein
MNEQQAENGWPDRFPRVTAVQPRESSRLELSFDNGVSGVVDFEGWLIGTGCVMEPLADPEFFRQVSVDKEAGTIRWPMGSIYARTYSTAERREFRFHLPR